MPSPFPGLDPFIEDHDWDDFHTNFIVELARALVPRVRPRYIVRTERRIYVEHELGEGPPVIFPDVSVLSGTESALVPTAAGTAIEPVVLTLPLPEPRHEVFLTIRRRDTLDVVTVIEFLSPGNKRPGSDGRKEYLSKRNVVLQSSAHLVELDLLRTGRRLPTIEPLPQGDYYAFVSPSYRRPHVEVYAWSLRDRMPSVPVPLSENEPDVCIELQDIFTRVYDEMGYDYSLNYDRPPATRVSEADAEWIRQQLAGRS